MHNARIRVARMAAVVIIAGNLGIGTTVDGADGVAASQNASAAESGKLGRGQKLRAVLLDTLEEAYRNDGEWPQRLAGATQNAADLVYCRPDKMEASQPGSVWRSGSKEAVTVVLYERPEKNPGGFWVGYADGHLEFVASAAELAECQNSGRISRSALPEAAPLPAMTGGQLKLKILDPAGKPVAGAEICFFEDFGDQGVVRAAFDILDGLASNTEGEVTIAATTLFDAKFIDQPSAPIYIRQERLDLAGQLELQRSDFAAPKAREVRLSPACHVRGELSSVGLAAAGEALHWTNTIIFKPGALRWYTMNCSSNEHAFDFPMPPGDYGIEAYGRDCGSVYRYFHLEPGQRELKLELDLPPDTAVRLVGQPAPELRNIKGWEHGGPVELADLRGKVVLLDFWGYWCSPCVASMPALMKLHDEFKDKGLVIIAVHNDTADSIQDMDAKLEKVRHEAWAGWGDRDLPFRVALDGGGPTRIKFSSATADGVTTAAYGIQSYPTTIAIGRDGRVVGAISVRSPDIRSRIQKLLGE